MQPLNVSETLISSCYTSDQAMSKLGESDKYLN